MKKATTAPDVGLSSPQALNQAVWQICDVLRRAGVGSAIRYVPELTWILFLRVLDEQEAIEREEAEALGLAYEPSLASPYRWQDWAAPWSDKTDAPRRQRPALGLEAAHVAGRQARRLRRLRQRRVAALSARPALTRRGDAETEGDQRDHFADRAGRHRHREQFRRRARPRPCAAPGRHRYPAPVHAVPGIRGLAAEDGREELGRRPVLHAARTDPRHGAGGESAYRPDCVRPLLRHRRFPGGIRRTHAGARQRTDHGRPRCPQAPYLLRPRDIPSPWPI